MVRGSENPGPDRVAEFVEADEPAVPIGFDELRTAAMDDTAGAYVPGGAEAEDTVDRNRTTFDRWRIGPRMLRGVADCDLTIDRVGRPHTPIVPGHLRSGPTTV